jgi:hypothetical protein
MMNKSLLAGGGRVQLQADLWFPAASAIPQRTQPELNDEVHYVAESTQKRAAVSGGF